MIVYLLALPTFASTSENNFLPPQLGGATALAVTLAGSCIVLIDVYPCTLAVTLTGFCVVLLDVSLCTLTNAPLDASSSAFIEATRPSRSLIVCDLLSLLVFGCTYKSLSVLTVSKMVCTSSFFMLPLRSTVLTMMLRAFSIPSHTSSVILAYRMHVYVCMHVCMYAYVCVYVCVYVCMYMYVCMYVCMYVRTYYVCVYVYVCMYVCMYVRIMYVCMYLYVCMCICVYVCMYVCIMYVCVYVCTMSVCIMYVCMYVLCMCICIYVCVYVYICLHVLCMYYVCMCMCMYVCMCVCICMYVCFMFVCVYVSIYKDVSKISRTVLVKMFA